MSYERSNNSDLLTILLAEETLKPYAKEKKYKASEEVLEKATQCLSVLKKDSAILTSLITEAESKNNTSLGVMRERLANGQVSFSIESDEAIEAHKSGNISRDTAKIETSYINKNFQLISNYTTFAIEGLKRLLDKEQGNEISYLEAEKLSRVVSVLAEEVPRTMAKKLYGDEEGADKMLASLNQMLDRDIGNDAYVIARRLVGKYYGATSLEELDGNLTVNVVSKEKKDIPLLADLESTFDTMTGIRYLTPRGMIGLVRKFEKLSVKKDNVSELISSRKTINVSVDNNDLGLFKKALGYIDEGVFDKKIAGEKEAEALLGKILDKDGTIEKSKDTKEGRLAILNALADTQITAWAGCYEYDLGKLDKENDGLRNIRQTYQELFDANQIVKNLAISKACEIDFESDKRDGTNGFPFDAKDPYESLHLGRLLTLYFESETMKNKLSALSLNWLDKNSATAREKAKEVERLQERAKTINRNTKGKLGEIFLTWKENDIRQTLTETLKDKEMMGTKKGWFKSDRLRLLLSESAEKILYSFNEINDETLEKVIKNLDSVPTPAIKKSGRNIKEIIEDGTKIKIVEPPDVDAMTMNAKFRFLANVEITSDIDAAVPKGSYAYYDDHKGMAITDLVGSYKNDIIKGSAEDENSKAYKAYAEINRFVELVKENGGENERCVKVLQEAQEKAREIFIEDYINNINAVKSAVALKGYMSDGGKKDLSLALRDKGKELGDELIKKITSDVLERIGYKDEANEIKNNKEEFSPITKYALSIITEATVGATLEKSQLDSSYYETKNSGDSIWNEVDGTKDNGIMMSLAKGTMPYMTDRVLKDRLYEITPHSDIAESLGVLSLYPKERGLFKSEEFKKYAELLRSENEKAKLDAERYNYNIDIKKAWDDTLKLKIAVMSYTGTSDDKKKIDNLFNAVIEDNPLNSERVLEVKEMYDNLNWLDGKALVNLLQAIDDSRYTTPYAFMNKDIVPKSNILSKEIREFEKAREKAKVTLEDAIAFEKIPVEDRAAIIVATNALFSDTHIAVQALVAETKKRFSSPDEMVEFEREVLKGKGVIEEALKRDFYKDITTDMVSLALKEGQTKENLQQIAVDGVLPKGCIIESAKDPRGRMYSLPADTFNRYYKDAFALEEGEKKENLRTGALYQAFCRQLQRKSNVIQPFAGRLKSIEPYAQVLKKSEKDTSWERIHMKYISMRTENLEYGLKDERLRVYEKPMRKGTKEEALAAKKEFLTKTNALIERSRV